MCFELLTLSTWNSVVDIFIEQWLFLIRLSQNIWSLAFCIFDRHWSDHLRLLKYTWRFLLSISDNQWLCCVFLAANIYILAHFLFIDCDFIYPSFGNWSLDFVIRDKQTINWAKGYYATKFHLWGSKISVHAQ